MVGTEGQIANHKSISYLLYYGSLMLEIGRGKKVRMGLIKVNCVHSFSIDNSGTRFGCNSDNAKCLGKLIWERTDLIVWFPLTIGPGLGKGRKIVGLKIKKKGTKANAIIIKWPPIR